jgi:hypothetical protein
MKKVLVPCLLFTLLIPFGGCAITSPIQRVGDSKSQFDGAVYGGEMTVVNEDKSGGEQYRVFHQAATGFVTLQSIRFDAEQRAREFCDREGKMMRTLSEQIAVPPYILGNFPRIEIIFACVGKPALPVPLAFEDTRYIKLTNLKKLFDAGAITQGEFDVEKAKILNLP